MLPRHTLASLLLASLLVSQSCAANNAFDFHSDHLRKRAIQAAERAHTHPPLQSRKENYRYYNEKTKPYFIESWPDVRFDTGEFYSGNVCPEVRWLERLSNLYCSIFRCLSTSPTLAEHCFSSSNPQPKHLVMILRFG